ncbi:hypothetical protein MK805_06460 [Shimazuella sp. AN120528]|uniref:alpha/beta fold hydrolase n=1 Tax=Shimazuella soli TaxID=1892854 RepID=UPI001F10EBBC|nr:hypothetical protein [Shimazuella soli]MCH5584610.1 hypothetical protein [Shimazuella soli]
MIKQRTYHNLERKTYSMVEKNNVVSLNGTNIPCRVVGKGPSLVVLHGKFRSTYDYEKLCRNLAHRFTVYGINHRGHGGNVVQGWITVCKKTG